MVVAAGVPVTIMIYGESGNAGVAIVCYGTGSEDIPPVTEGERVEMAILGASSVDVINTDPLSLGKIEEKIREELGEGVVQTTMQAIKLHARTLGFPLD